MALPLARTVGELLSPCVVLAADVALPEVEALFQTDRALDLVVTVVADGFGLLTRTELDLLLVGPLGFGRALHVRHHLRDVVVTDVLTLQPETSLPRAAEQLLQRAAERRHDPAVVLHGGRTMVLRPTTLFVALAAHYEVQACTDGLTGLPNRSRLLEALTAQLAEQGTGAVVYLDLDGFKQVNDSLGHDAGDALLRTLGERLRLAIGAEHLVGRLAGDEFAVVVSDPDQACEVAQAAVDVASTPYAVGDRVVRLAASAGVAVAGAGTQPDLLLSAADRAMYRAKRSGGSSVAVYDVEVDSAHDSLAQTQRLRRDVERGRLVLAYQPIVALPGRQVVGAEALLRWRAEDGRTVPPAEIVPFAEKHGLMPALGRRVLHAAVEQASRWWGDQGELAPVMSVNLSPTQLADDRIVHDVAAALKGSGLPPSRLRLEVTESAAMHDLDSVSRRLRAMRDMGVSVALDDFGTGYSSLVVLRDLPVDAVKVDRAFVASVDDDGVDATLVRLVLAMAHALGMSVTAEGVERYGQLAWLVEAGCDTAQGWLFGRPVPADEFPLVSREHEHAPPPRVAVACL